MSVLQQPQNVVNSDKHERVPQNVSMNFRNIASRNDQVTTRINSGSNDPPKLSLEDAYTGDSHLQAISGYGLKNRDGALILKKPFPHCTIHLDSCRPRIINVYLSRFCSLENAMSHLAFDIST